MSKQITGSAIAVPAQSQLDNFEQLSVVEQQQVVAQVEGMAAITANEALKSDQGYDILNKLYENCGGMVMHTSPWVLPVKEQLNDIKRSLSDPEGFERGFNSLCNDIATFNDNLSALYECHKGMQGAPSEEQAADVLALADGYSTLQTHFERGIQPLMSALAQTVEREHCPVLEKELDANA